MTEPRYESLTEEQKKILEEIGEKFTPLKKSKVKNNDAVTMKEFLALKKKIEEKLYKEKSLIEKIEIQKERFNNNNN